MSKPRKTVDDLRSARWFGPDDLRSFGHRSRMMQMGLAAEDYIGKPIIGILNTWSEMNPCHLHFRDRAEDVKKGVSRPAASRWKCRPSRSTKASPSRPRCCTAT